MMKVESFAVTSVTTERLESRLTEKCKRNVVTSLFAEYTKTILNETPHVHSTAVPQNGWHNSTAIKMAVIIFSVHLTLGPPCIYKSARHYIPENLNTDTTLL
jgi:hypothetical protein